MKKKFKERTTIIPVSPFGYEVKVIITNDFPRSIDKLKHTISGYTVTDNAGAFTCTAPGYERVHLFLPDTPSLRYMGHETFHIVDFILRDIGAKFEEEIWAYFQGDLLEKIAMFALNVKHTKRKKNNGIRKNEGSRAISSSKPVHTGELRTKRPSRKPRPVAKAK